MRDAFPVSRGHTLVITMRRIPTWWEATDAERLAVLDLVSAVKAWLDEELHPDGYNAGEVAGQTVPHLHVHVIPHFLGDVVDPRGGVRQSGQVGSPVLSARYGPTGGTGASKQWWQIGSPSPVIRSHLHVSAN